MAIKWFNIRSKEVVVAETEPQITALWASSDHSPNITQGQDFGWRLAPEVVVEMKMIKQNYNMILDLAKRYNVLPEDVNDSLVLQYISEKTDAADAPIAQDGDYQDEYDAEVRRLMEKKAAEAVTPTTVTTTTESLEQLRERVELEERLAAAKKINEAPAEETTTTTTTKPVTTTTTTKKP